MPRSEDPGLKDCLEQLRTDGDRRLSARELADIIGEVALTLTSDIRPRSEAVPTAPSVAEPDPAAAPAADMSGALQALSFVVCSARGDGQLGELKDELLEIRNAMQGAASTFLSAAEAIENIASHQDMDGDDQAHLYQHATAIFEASSFQDITGQRLTRVSEMLDKLELAIIRAQAALGDDAAAQAIGALATEVDRTETRKVEYILHGPEKAGSANTQEEIDKILASFD